MLHLAYADPPYLGQSKLYPEHPDADVWDNPEAHINLMRNMHASFDGWALSASAPSLAAILAGAPAGARVAAWVKPFAAYKRNVRVAYTWEPVIWCRVAPRRDGEPVGRDHLAEPITLRKGLTGAKPERFAQWLMTLLGWLPGDELRDLFPGTGIVTRTFAAGVPLNNAKQSRQRTVLST
jgi:DNA-binding transcriptional LysR family regulator